MSIICFTEEKLVEFITLCEDEAWGAGHAAGVASCEEEKNYDQAREMEFQYEQGFADGKEQGWHDGYEAGLESNHNY